MRSYVRSHIDQRRWGDVPYMYMFLSIQHETFWELTGSGSHKNSKVIPRMGDLLGSSRAETQKQNREGMVSPKRTISCYGGVELGCDVTIWYQNHSAVRYRCADEGVEPLRG
ncbi:hypothetical protein DVH24_024268 [Malus domestica]|uniref:Uncharacterized protein n=1 Tax=Malus domestica TaxID=3750 RepID=A0A498JKW8_MALDO|nr:hypothetical protein DVH24_024268 [Malus domestica]